nr:hypothetical protein [Chroococcidiopsis sp. [FACHB-1243]]
MSPVALRLIKSNDLVAYEDLNVKGMVKNRRLSKSILDTSWSTFRRWLDDFGYKYGKVTLITVKIAQPVVEKCRSLYLLELMFVLIVIVWKIGTLM